MKKEIKIKKKKLGAVLVEIPVALLPSEIQIKVFRVIGQTLEETAALAMHIDWGMRCWRAASLKDVKRSLLTAN